MHILSGTLKGKKLLLPPPHITRPMSDKLRARLFNRYQNLEGVCVLDLCAGSGAIALTAVSHGARQVVACEIHSKVYNILAKNTVNVSAIEIIHQDACTFLNHFKDQRYALWSNEDRENTVIAFCPPYEMHSLYESVLTEIKPWFNGQIWVESDTQKGISETLIASLLEKEAIKILTQGTSFIAIYNC